MSRLQTFHDSYSPPSDRPLHDNEGGQEGGGRGKKKLDRRLSIRLSYEDYAFLDYLSRSEGLKPSQVVRTLILKFLRYKKRQNLTSFVS